LYNILVEFYIPMKLERLINMCLSETHSNVRVGKHLSDMLPIQNGLKEGDVFWPLLLILVSECINRRVQVNQDGLKLNGKHQLPVHDADGNILGGNTHTLKRNTEAADFASKETGLEVNANKTK